MRFRLRTLLIATTLFAFWSALVSLLPYALSELVVGAIWIAATSWLVVGVLFTRGDRRAFYIGALLVVTSTWTGVGGRYMGGFHQLISVGPLATFTNLFPMPWIDLAMIAGTAIANGWFCVWARRFFERQSDR